MIKVLKYLVLVFVFLFIFASKVSAQVVINEVSPASNPEWVELYNISSSSVSLKEYTIDFGSDSQKKFFCSNEQIGPNGYKLIILTSNWLNNAGDVVNLRSGDDIIDTIGYGPGYSLAKPSSGTDSITRFPDGSETWIMTNKQSQQGDVVSFDCPTPTPTPTPTTTPTSTPTSTPTPTKTPSPASTKSPTPKPTVASSPTSTSEELVLGIQNNTVTPSSTPEEEVVDKKKFPVFPVILIVTGFLCIAGAVFFFIKNNVKKVI